MRVFAFLFAVAVLSPFSAIAQTPAAPADPAAPPASDPNIPPTGTPAPAPAEMPPPAPPPAAVVVVTPAPAPPPFAPPPVAVVRTWRELITLEGLVDAYYLYNFTGSDKSTPPGGRQFDTNSNAFTLSYAKIGLGVAPEPVGLRLDLGYGGTGAIINSSNSMSTSTISQIPFYLQQAYATAAIGALTLDFGKFVTTAGAEVIEANKNWLYSRSILFFNIPLHHTGLRATVKVTPELTLQGSVVNGWNDSGFDPDNNNDKTFGVSLSFTAPTGTSVIATGYFGDENPAGVGDLRILADLVVAHTMGNFGLNLNVDYIDDNATVYDNFIGVALMARFALSDNLVLAARGEYAQNGPDTKLYEGTVMLGVPVAGRYEFRAELRADFANSPIFDASTDGTGDENQFTGLGAFLAWF